MSQHRDRPPEGEGIVDERMNMGAALDRAVDRFPDRTAIVDHAGDIRWTYEEWNARVRALGAALQARGVGPGDRVGIVVENRAEVMSIYWATQLIGAVFTPFNFRAAPGELEYLANNVDVSTLFFSEISRESVLDAAEEFEHTEDLVYVDEDVPGSALDYGAFLEAGDGCEEVVVGVEETSLVLHTSGTTGDPKAVPITHRANYARTVGNPIHLDWQQGESTLGIMPNFHEMGRAAMSSTVYLNGTYVAQRAWSPERGVELIEEEGIDILYLVPTMFHDLVDYEGIEDADLSSVRSVGYAGTAMSERVHERVVELFVPDTFVNFYGTSEMNCMTTCRWLGEKPGCAGRAGIHTAMRVVEAEEGTTVSPDRTVETGELGEVIIDATSAEAFDGYPERPEANETSFEDGWYFTGDLGYLDEDGDLWVVGRVDDMIISGGENIYPVEIEDVLDANDLVDDIAVGSLTDERLGETVTAYVTVAEGRTDYEAIAEELDEFCTASDRLSDFKRPRRYVFVEEIPKSNVGKKLRRKLRSEDLDDIEVSVIANVRP